MDVFKFRDPDYIWPALGKSGDEAMHLGCMVITRGANQELYPPCPPVMWYSSGEKLEEIIDYYDKNPNAIGYLAWKQYRWARKYGTHDAAARNLLNLDDE